MWGPNQRKIEQLVGNGLVLDIGGWVKPFPRADYVIDIFPYETRGIASHGIGCLPTTCVYPEPLPNEHFRKETWIIHDICSEKPFPFPDKMFDFVVCSQTLEDIRDPIRACSEIIRVGRAGYIETPSRLGESIIDFDRLIGGSHHRWLVEIEGNCILFRVKHHFLHTQWKYHVPASYRRVIDPSQTIVFLFWEGSFEYQEVTGYEFHRETSEYIASLNIPKYLYWLDCLRSIKHRLKGSWQNTLQAFKKSVSPPQDNDNEVWTWEKLFEANKLYLDKLT
jgi:SAM-dependent methyltransferase